MRSVLKQVADEFGEDAAILSSQKTPSGVEVIAALDYDEALLPESPDLVETSSLSKEDRDADLGVDMYANDKQKRARTDQQNSLVGESLSFENSLTSIDSTKAEIAERSTLKNESSAPLQSRAVAKNKTTSLEWSTDPGLTAMKEELGLMRSMMSEQLKGIGWERFSEKEPLKAMMTRRFVSMGVSQVISDRLIPAVRQQQDVECSWQNLLALFAKSLNTNCQNILTQGGIFAFMGPTGSGKSTAIAKIAARFVIRHGVDSVLLISADDYRLSAQQQLSGFAKILGVQMVTTNKRRTIDDLIDNYKSKKLILIDTAGYSKNDSAIASQLERIKNSRNNIKRFLMMPATNQESVLRQSILQFKRYAPYSVIISKIDEATSLGEVLSIIVENNLPIAFTTDGQRVPEDIREAKSHQLVSKAVLLTNKYGKRPEDWELAQEQQAMYA